MFSAPPEEYITGKSVSRQKNKQVEISLCVIYRNEERNLPGFIAAISGLADEYVFVDTGSSDRSREILSRSGYHSHFFPWNDDFSAARNYSLSLAGKSYVLVLDLDEEISAADFSCLKDRVAANPGKAFLLNLVNFSNDFREPGWRSSRQLPERFHKVAAGFSVSPMVRLFPNLPTIRFRGRIHEMVAQSLQENDIGIVSTEVPVYHFGWTNLARSDGELAAKRRQYREIHLQEWRSHDDPQSAYYYLVSLDDQREKIRQALHLSGKYPQFRFFWEQLAITAANLAEWPRALAYAERGLVRHPDNETLKAVKAAGLNETGQPLPALEIIEELLRINPDQPLYLLEKFKSLLLARRRAEALAFREKLPADFPGELLSMLDRFELG